ncbi:MAG TPA: Cof-type HAD-IIB family hydrolase [Acidimicrobiales bacterium]|nr:Cof-type HAD-IIB family hydrolase [Acidimicrobiales bacterium]
MSAPAIRLVLSDVDGTLVTPEKVLTKKTIAAVERLGSEGILFAVTSGRPPRGLTMLIEPLDLTTPLAAFNGGLVVNRELVTLKELTVRDESVGPIIEILSSEGLSVWVYQGTDWFVLDLNGPHVAHEADVCQFGPSALSKFDLVRGDIIKVVGVSDDPAVIASATTILNEQFAQDVSATSSQTYYLDVTHRDANKGSVVDYLAHTLSMDASEIATIGDMSNDILMFARSGMSIAMGNASDEVKGSATYVTSSNEDEGFSHAIEDFLLGASRQ